MYYYCSVAGVDMTIAFDIETSKCGEYSEMIAASFYDDVKQEFDIYRYWDDVAAHLERLDALGEPIIIWAHNLNYDISHLIGSAAGDYLQNGTAFFVKAAIAKCRWGNNITFRCTYLLTRMGLDGACFEFTGERLKTDGWDYDKIRTARSVLTPDELLYCRKDVEAVCAIVGGVMDVMKIDTEKQLPLTGAGIVRNMLSDSCVGKRGTDRTQANWAHWRAVHGGHKSTEEFMLISRAAYRGGVVDLNPDIEDEVLDDLGDYDMTSQYPYLMATRLYPYGSERRLDPKKACLLDYMYHEGSRRGWIARLIVNWTANPKLPISPLTVPDWLNQKSAIIRNVGSRVFEAKNLQIDIVSRDYHVLEQTGTIEIVSVVAAWDFLMAPLPNGILSAIFKAYAAKTSLKGVKGKERDYSAAKITFNTIYGLAATGPFYPNRVLDDLGAIDVDPVDVQRCTTKYNTNNYRLNHVAWGAFVAAGAHDELFNVMLQIGQDVCYVDTDSCKFRNPKKHAYVFEAANARIAETCRATADLYRISATRFSAQNVAGESFMMGVWTDDSDGGQYVFKRPKFYAHRSPDSDWNYISSGIPSGVIFKNIGNDIEKFKRKNFIIPPDRSDKLTHAYVFNAPVGLPYTGDDGTTGELTSTTCMTLNPAPFEVASSSYRLDRKKHA